MLLNLIGFELRYHARQAAFRAACLIYFLLGMAMARGNFGGVEVFAYSPFSLTFKVGIFSLAAIIHIALFAGSAILRDRETRMEPIIYATNITHFQYLVSRYVGLAVASFLALTPMLCGMFVARFVPGFQPDFPGPLRILPFLWVWLVIALPNVLVGVSTIFATASLSRNAMATYVSGVGLYVLYWVGSMLGNSPLIAGSSLTAPEDMEMSSLLEPFGLISLINHTRYWSVADKNTLYPVLEGTFLMNRLLWIAFSVGAFVVVYRLFHFRRAAVATRSEQVVVESGPGLKYEAISPQASQTLRGLTVFWAQSRIAFRSIVKSYAFLAVLVLWAGLVMITLIQRVQRGELGVPMTPFTDMILPFVMDPLLSFGALFVVFFAVETVWRERLDGIADMVDATPAPDVAFWGARLGGLALMIGALISFTIVLVIAFQAVYGVFDFDMIFLMLYPYAGVPLLAIAALTILLQHLAPNKYAGMGLAFLMAIFFTGVVVTTSLFVSHPLLRLGLMPPMELSPMAGDFYGDIRLYYLCYTLGVSGLLGLLSLKWRRRGREARWSSAGLTGNFLGWSSLALMLFGGGFIYVNMNIARPYYTDAQQEARQAEFERRFDELVDKPQPGVTAVNVGIDLYPEKRLFSMKGHLVLENRNEEPLESVILGIADGVTLVSATLEGAVLQKQDADYPYYFYRFNQPMKPGQAGKLVFELESDRSGFSGIDPEIYVTPQASYVEFHKVLPFFGVDTGMYLQGERERQEHGLPPRKADPHDHHSDVIPDFVTFDITASGPSHQTLVAPGIFGERRQEGGRIIQTFSTGPVPARFAVASAVYETHHTRAGDIPINLYVAPGHDQNVEAVLASARESLIYFQENFGPYPYETLMMAELPSFSDTFGGTAYAGGVFGVENRTFLVGQNENTIDVAGRVMSHELAHQWWGNMINPKAAPGARLLTEFLAVYSETVLTRKRYGYERLEDYLAQTRDLYFFFRGYQSEPEEALARVNFQPYVYYFKGAHVAFRLLEVMGEDRINAVLRDLLASYPYPAKPVASDLVTRLKAAAPEHEALITELFEQVVTYDVHIQGVEMIGEAVVADIHAERVVWKDGRPGSGTLAEPVDISLWRGNELVRTETLIPQKVRGKIRFENAKGVDRISIDHRYLLLEIDTSDNSRRLTTE